MPSPTTVDDYINTFPDDVQHILRCIRQTVHEAAPRVTEKISYGMPTFMSKRVILHVGAFKDHIGLFPPVREPHLQSQAQPYKGVKGNLRFPLDQPIPYDLVRQIVQARAAPRA